MAEPEHRLETPADDSPLARVQVEVVVSVGRTRAKVRDLMRLGPDSILPIDRRIEDPVELWVGDRLIARGELQELDGAQAGQLAVRLTDVAGPDRQE
ncbi:FliM/FliN family flagellar motor C-terminal domain-containing protein [Roseicyclus sp. F158]|uniref:FliM/FliN family flagellar motor C-terminal domain-containing protein n=1 Tax=Tropicimonas omnivorans TaxID=3075590 RepID=A0ABU3DEW3_9RHOB|nr:FliM/FliN family flagellar motor C-terminal domain-containing protein [Roseicyclus sp. F158]MDT0681672.1 FliM/FliN family flagellar motor C-terminal domain-containing protein [Roseicyclus sp. F158]